MRRVVAILLAACLAPGAARAEWQEASSRHFVLYANDKPERVRAFTTRLERFDKALRVQRGMPDEPISPEARLTVYVLGSPEEVQRLSGMANAAGYYKPRAHAVAFVARTPAGESYDLNAQQILLHEYTHHFMLSNWTNAAFPAWLVEGFAEFNATAMFGEDGAITLGIAPRYRAFGVFNAAQLPIRRVLQPNPGPLNEDQTQALYGRGWLLTHYLTFEQTRAGQLDAYIAAINTGKPVAEAQKELKELDQLDRLLDRYAMRPRLPARTLKGPSLAVGQTTVRQLTPGEAAVMPVRIRSQAEVTARTAPGVAALARKLAAPFPNDPAAQNALAEAEYDAEQFAAADAAAARALAADPKSMHAMLYRGLARQALALAAKKSDAATWNGVRRWFLAANKVDTEDPLPLSLFYYSFAAAGQQPTKNADAALLYAYNLAPYDLSLRYTAGGVFLQQDNMAEARRAIVPLAYSPHGGGETARRVLVALDATGTAGALAEMETTGESDAKETGATAGTPAK